MRNSWKGISSTEAVINYSELDAEKQKKQTLQPKDEIKNLMFYCERNHSVAHMQTGHNLYHQVCMKKCLT